MKAELPVSGYCTAGEATMWSGTPAMNVTEAATSRSGEAREPGSVVECGVANATWAT
jgi:hypothetical protein